MALMVRGWKKRRRRRVSDSFSLLLPFQYEKEF